MSARKYDGREHRRWPARLKYRSGPLLVLDAEFIEEIQHDLLGTIERGTRSTEFYWLDKWYNVFRFAEPGGRVRSFYCNINIPPTFDGEVLVYVDLEIDVLVQADRSYQVLDEDEFAANADIYGYPPEVRERVSQALEELLGLVERGEFPFDQA